MNLDDSVRGLKFVQFIVTCCLHLVPLFGVISGYSEHSNGRTRIPKGT